MVSLICHLALYAKMTLSVLFSHPALIQDDLESSCEWIEEMTKS